MSPSPSVSESSNDTTAALIHICNTYSSSCWWAESVAVIWPVPKTTPLANEPLVPTAVPVVETVSDSNTQVAGTYLTAFSDAYYSIKIKVVANTNPDNISYDYNG